jgi:hypothetical protein
LQTICLKINQGLKKLDLVTRKGVFPYEYIDSWNKLNETRLPPRSAFYNFLKDEEINDDDYSHAKKYEYGEYLI